MSTTDRGTHKHRNIHTFEKEIRIKRNSQVGRSILQIILQYN